MGRINRIKKLRKIKVRKKRDEERKVFSATIAGKFVKKYF